MTEHALEFLPPELVRLVDDLGQRQFGIVDENYDPEYFGDAMVQLAHHDLSVRLLRERGQWFVVLSGPHQRDWFEPVVWRAWLEAEMPPLEPMSLSSQVDFVLESLGAIEDALSKSGDELLEDLRSWRSRRAELQMS